LIGLRWHEPDLTAIDEWRRKQPDMPSRADVIRSLVKLGLGAAKRPGGPDPVVPVRLPKAVVADIDRWAKREKIERSKAVRALIEKGLADALDE
jgi:Arc/MetJ-type ribon-helix-helix transcriptional regulator